MIRRLLLTFAMVAPCMWGQMGVYGRITTQVKSGDRAPDLVFDRTLSSPAPSQWDQANLTGGLTVLAFMPDTSDNAQIVTLWNGVADKFAGKGVQFVWITGEGETKLMPWLGVHPIKGWVLEDPKGQTGNAYGMEMPETVIVGADRRIVGFSMGPVEESTVQAALDGRITTTPQTQASLKAFMEARLVLMSAEPMRMMRVDDHRPTFSPSDALHVSPAHAEGGGNFSGGDFQVLDGYTLKSAIEDFYGVDTVRIELPAALDDGKRYDFAILLPPGEGREKIKEHAQKGLEDYFHLTTRRVDRSVDVYVVTAVPGRKPPPADELRKGGSSIGAEGGDAGEDAIDPSQLTKAQRLQAIRDVSVEGTTAQFCGLLEGMIDRPVIDETSLEGDYDFSVNSPRDGPNHFLELVRERLGLAIAPGQRSVEMLVVSAR